MMNNDYDIDWNKVNHMEDSKLLELANELHESLYLDQAKNAYSILLKRNPQNIKIVDLLTDCMEQLGEIDEMKKILQQYLPHEQLIMAYENNFKFLFKFAQTLDGLEAIKYYEYGIQLLKPKINQDKTLLRDMGDAHASIAEIYQTDLLEHKESEQGCVKNIEQAFMYDPMNLDAFLQLANYHLNKEQEEQAIQDLKMIHQQVITYQQEADEDFLLQISKLMVEVGSFVEGVDITRKLVDTNADSAENLYMLAFCLWKTHQNQESLKLVTSILQLQDIQQDQEIYSGTIELKGQIEKEDMGQTDEHEWMDLE
ncbi:hypothetical protein pb186bvf_011502 [Paramecium bursaria]